MKRAVILGVVVAMMVVFVGCCQADNAERIAELEVERTELTVKGRQYQQVIRDIDRRIVGIGAIIAELKQQDVKPVEKEKK